MCSYAFTKVGCALFSETRDRAGFYQKLSTNEADQSQPLLSTSTRRVARILLEVHIERLVGFSGGGV